LPYPRNAKLREGEDALSKILPAGTRAPDFRLRVTPDQDLSLSELAGNPVILAFYPADWSPVCGDQKTLYNEVLPENTGRNSSASRSMGRGAIRLLRGIAGCISR
jgi:peroxiredoxin